MNSFCNSATTGPSICRSVSRHGSLLAGPPFALELNNEPPEYTLLILMPPMIAVCPSVTSSLRWSRWFTSQPTLAVSGLIGLNSSTLMPASLSFVKNSFGVLIVPTLSWIRFTCTPACCFAIKVAAKRLPTSSSSRM